MKRPPPLECVEETCARCHTNKKPSYNGSLNGVEYHACVICGFRMEYPIGRAPKYTIKQDKEPHRMTTSLAPSSNGHHNGQLVTKAQITRTELNQLVLAKAQERFNADKSKQEAERQDFEARYGRIDKIDESFLRDLQSLQVRAAAITARQQHAGNVKTEPKTAKFVEALGTMIGQVSAYLATEKALELFKPIADGDYLRTERNYNHNTRGMEERTIVAPSIARQIETDLLEQYEVINNVPAPQRDEEDEDMNCSHVGDLQWYPTARALTEGDDGDVRTDDEPDAAHPFGACNACEGRFVRDEYGTVVEVEFDDMNKRAKAEPWTCRGRGCTASFDTEKKLLKHENACQAMADDAIDEDEDDDEGDEYEEVEPTDEQRAEGEYEYAEDLRGEDSQATVGAHD